MDTILEPHEFDHLVVQAYGLPAGSEALTQVMRRLGRGTLWTAGGSDPEGELSLPNSAIISAEGAETAAMYIGFVSGLSEEGANLRQIEYLIDWKHRCSMSIFMTEASEGDNLILQEFTFWLSHVPPSEFESFWRTVDRALAPGGRAFFVDNTAHGQYEAVDQVAPGDEEWRATRTLEDGREFKIVKIFYEPEDLEERLRSLGWQGTYRKTETFFIQGEVSR